VNEKLKGMPRPNVICLYQAPEREEYTRKCWEELGVADVNFIRFNRWPDANSGKPDPIIIHEAPDWIAKGTFTSHTHAIKHWYETTDEPYGIFFEDDVDYSTIQYWNFTFEEFVERMGNRWGALHLCNVYEHPWNMWTDEPIMVPRMREYYDHGLQAYMVTRDYAKKLVRFYFDHEYEEGIRWRMPQHPRFVSTENNILLGIGRVFHFPLFNHNVIEFDTVNIYGYEDGPEGNRGQAKASVMSYEKIDKWWKEEGQYLTLDEIFDTSRQTNKKFMEIVL